MILCYNFFGDIMRLDKYLSNLKFGSRTDIKKIAKSNRIKVNDKIIKDPSLNINPSVDVICLDDNIIEYKENIYMILHKPADYVCSNTDVNQTVFDLLKEPYNRYDLKICGRLDKDTEGLLLLTNDGQFVHNIIQPNKNLYKEYYCKLANNITVEDKNTIEKGVRIKDKKDYYLTQPSFINILSDKEITIRIKEGKFHQVKRMLEFVDNEVIYLKRLKIGNLTLGELKLGEYKELTKEEIDSIYSEK